MSHSRDFPGDPVKNPPCNAGDMSLTPRWEIKLPHAMEQLRPNEAK